ncbi:terminase [Catenuloplanes sp. NPDC051500]|uniref:terminase n=1 Tax=Catenuloplanes sp. NPDC051500 TaxID=3363959 RepID=UPI003793A378
MATVTLTPEEIDALEPDYIGPTWQRGVFGEWILPKATLGWEVAAWCADYLLAEDGGPWRFTAEQLRFVLHWYAVDEYSGRFNHRVGILQRLKGWGKDPLLAVLCLVEFLGPSRFSHWDKERNPVGKAHPQAWVQVAAVNREQTKNTMTLLPSLMSQKLIETYGIKAGAELIRAGNGTKRLEAVTSSYRALEGARSTFVCLNETQHWVSGNNGHSMMETIDGNITKKDSRYLAITNAYLPGEDSVAERMREAYEKVREGKAEDVGVMYDSVEADPRTPLTPEALRIVIPKIRGDAVWLNVDAIIKSTLSLVISPARARRMYLNMVVADEDALYGPEQLRAIENAGATLQPGDEITLGFDGGKTGDDTALVAYRLSDATSFVLGHWFKPEGPKGDDWQVDKGAVDSAVREAHALYNVRGFYADVALWESHIADWEADFAEGYSIKASERSPVGLDMRQNQRRLTLAHERIMQTIFDAKTFYDGDPAMRRAALSAYRRVNNYGVSFGKLSRESSRKVDLYAAWMLAHEAAYDVRTRGKKKVQRTGRGYFL